MLVHWGFRLVAGGVVASAVCVMLVWDPLSFTIISGCLLIAGTLVGGIVGSLGRVRCLDTPPAFPTARGRIRLAVILEGCGLLSGVVNLGVGWAVATWKITLPVEVWCVVFLFAFVLFVAGRIFFYAFTVALAKGVGMKPTTLLSAVAVMMIIMGSTVTASAVGLQVIAHNRTEPIFQGVPIAGMAFVVALVTFGTLHAIGRWFRRLREAVTQFNTRPVEVEHVEG